MARLVNLGKKENRRRSKLSKFALCVDDAEIFKDHRSIVKFLRSNPLTMDDQELLANYLEKLKIKRGQGRSKYKPLIRFDWLGMAGVEAKAILYRWKGLTRGRRKVKLRGSLVNVRDAVCERVAARHGHANAKDVDKLITYINQSN